MCGRRPHVARASLFTRELATCDCGAALAMPCTYVDLERRQAVRVEAPASLPSWRSLERTGAADLARLTAHGSPYIGRIARELHHRLVFSLEELREKLVVWSHGLDDAAVECAKVRAFSDAPELAAPSTRIVVDRISDDDTLTCHCSTSMFELPGTWVREAHRDRESLERRFPELFTGTFVDARRYFTP